MATCGGVSPPTILISPPQCRLGLGCSGIWPASGGGGVVAVNVIDRLMRPTSARPSMPKFCAAGSLKLSALGADVHGAVHPSTVPHATALTFPCTEHSWLGVGAPLPKWENCNGWLVFTMLPPMPSAV